MKNLTRKFKSIEKINIKTKNGDSFTNVEGELIGIVGDRVYLKGSAYDFSISLNDYKTKNIKVKILNK